MEYLKYICTAKVIEGTGYVYYLPYNYALKYGQNITEVTNKLGLMEDQVQLIENRFKIDLSWAKKMKWHHGLASIDIIELYENNVFTEFIHWYNVKVGDDYTGDVGCNREARAANILLQIVGKSIYRKKYEALLSLLCLHIKKDNYNLNKFPHSIQVILFIASLQWKWLLKMYLSVVYGHR